MAIHELAPAKINLTLTVLGRRHDGYHELESLVTFADIGDALVLRPGPNPKVVVTGPFAGDIIGQNLLHTTLQLLQQRDASLLLGSVELVKNIPVAAGLGGGSADAAALLRAVRKANPAATNCPWQAIAAELGADVPVCFAGRPAFMRGVGERVEPLRQPNAFPPLAAVLVNPRLPLSTAAVFKALGAPSLSDTRRAVASVSAVTDAESLLGIMRAHGNDLEVPATALLPIIRDIKASLGELPGCHLCALAGSGPSCFGIFASAVDAHQGAAVLAARRPQWWIAATRLAGTSTA
jgi:4-diphosphocytidyl-2-C-methyl-D-erythritol kinase